MSLFTRLNTPSIPPESDTKTLAMVVANALGGLTDQINNLTVQGNWDANSNRLINVAYPSSPSDAANKAYVDQQTGGAKTGNTIDLGINNTITNAITLNQTTLSTATTTFNPGTTPALDALLYVIFKQDATGGRKVTFNAVFKLVTSDDISTDPNSYSVLQFVGDGTNWWLAAVPLLGRT